MNNTTQDYRYGRGSQNKDAIIEISLSIFFVLIIVFSIMVLAGA